MYFLESHQKEANGTSDGQVELHVTGFSLS